MGAVAFMNDGRSLQRRRARTGERLRRRLQRVLHDLLNEEGDALAASPERELFLKLQGVEVGARFPVTCGYDPRFFTQVDGRVYFRSEDESGRRRQP